MQCQKLYLKGDNTLYIRIHITIYYPDQTPSLLVKVHLYMVSVVAKTDFQRGTRVSHTNGDIYILKVRRL